MKKIISVILTSALLLTGTVMPAFAAQTKGGDVIVSQSEKDLEKLDKDIPVIDIGGFGQTIYRGLDTEDESDDTTVFSPDVSVLLPSLFKHIPGFLTGLIFENFDLIDKHLGAFMLEVFSDLPLNPDGTLKDGVGIKRDNVAEPKDEYGYANSYGFRFDWRKDMHTLAGELREFVKEVKAVTGSDKVALIAFSQGNCILSTYIYEYYYLEKDGATRDELAAVIFMCGAMNGVGACEDPMSGNLAIDSISLLRFLNTYMSSNGLLKGLYYLVEILYAAGVVDNLLDLVTRYFDERLDGLLDPYFLETFGVLPGFYAMMSPERYAEAEAFIFNTPEKQAKYAGMLEMNRYYHNEVQGNLSNVIDTMMNNGVNVAIIAEYGYPIAPVTTDNDRMTDCSITTSAESFGATCSDVDGILGIDYVQAKKCACGKNHVSCDLQIDASTCQYPDITWFGKNLMHESSSRYWGKLVDLIVYSDKQITVWDYDDLPQFMINYNNECLVPLTNDGTYAVAYENQLVFGKLRANGGSSFAGALGDSLS